MQPARAKIMGHPIHPMLVVFPIGLYIISFVFDLVYLSAGDPFWFRMAYWTMLGGLVGNVAAAIPGFLDYLTLPPKTEARQIANAMKYFPEGRRGVALQVSAPSSSAMRSSNMPVVGLEKRE